MSRSTDISNAFKAASVTTSDATVIPATRALWIGGAGNVAVRMAGDGSLVTYSGASAGILPVQVDKVLSTGTTATSILALY